MDAEVRAMKQALKAVSGLEPEAQKRVARWLYERIVKEPAVEPPKQPLSVPLSSSSNLTFIPGAGASLLK